MPTENYEIVAGVVIAIIVFLIAGFFIFILITYSNKRKKTFITEKQTLQHQFTEQLLHAQLEMQEHTFNTISQEIHDNVGQTLSLAKVQLNIIDQGTALNKPLLKDVKESVSKAMTDLRDIAKSLNSERIKLLGLTDMTTHELQRIERLGTIHTSCKIEGTEENLEDQKKLILFRIIQETIQNILKHSKAKNIDVFFCFQTKHLKIEIADNGIGFNLELLNKKEGLGLQNIINRAALVGGEANINSFIDKGTIITITLPYE